MAVLPTGTVTFLFTDIEGSTRLWEQHPEAMPQALTRHNLLLRQAIEAHGGYIFKTVGDQFCAAFATAPEALAAALEAQRAFPIGGEVGVTDARRGPDPGPADARPGTVDAPLVGGLPLRVRLALHTGVAEERDGDYFGPALNRAARLLALGHGGQTLLSQATFGLIRDALPEGASLRELGAHRLKDLQRPEQVFQFLHPALPADFPPLRSLDTLPHNLPLQLSSFIGREQEMADVKQRLGSTRLLTLTGAGGCGKTRLALQVAADVLEEYGDGVWLVELAALTDPALVPQELAAALGVREQPGRQLTATLLDYLKPRKLLLVLDNCEHLVTACAALAGALLRGCPDLRILATSREALGVAGEAIWRVPSFPTPDREARSPVDGLTQYDAVRLFIERAVAVWPPFAVTNQNAPAVAQLCHRLDGIPLAIELAAARVMLLSVEQIAARLDDRLRLLTGGSRTAPPRQQTLRAATDWSYDLLSEAERTLLRRLVVFAGGFTLEAAEKVCAGAGLEEGEVLNLLGQLADKSLVVREEQSDESCCRLLETIRQYGAEKLEGAGEAAAVRARHRDWYLELAERAEPQLRGPAQRQWLERLDRERDNVRAALDWAEESGEAEIGLRLAGALQRFWIGRSYTVDARKRLVRLLALAPAASQDPGDESTPSSERPPADHSSGPLPGAATAGRAKALSTAGLLAAIDDDYGESQSLHQEGLAIYRRLGDKRGIVSSLAGMAYAAQYLGDGETARRLWQEGLALWEEPGDRSGIAEKLGDPGHVFLYSREYAAARTLWEKGLRAYRQAADKQGIAFALNNLGQVLQRQGDLEAARSLHEESLAIFRELGTRDGVSWSQANLGHIARYQGDAEAARLCYQECLAINSERSDQIQIAWSLLGLGRIALDQGDLTTAQRLVSQSLAIFQERDVKEGIAHSYLSLGHLAVSQDNHGTARDHYEKALLLVRDLGDQWALTLSLEGFAGLAAAQGQSARGARLFGAADALREAIGSPRLPVEGADYDHKIAELRAALGAEAFAAAWAEGKAMTLEEAVQYAHVEAHPWAV